MTDIGLHMHSSYSDDGEFSPKEFLNLGKQVILGVELDCSYEGCGFHLLAMDLTTLIPFCGD